MTCIDLKSDWPIMPDFGGTAVDAYRQAGFLAIDGVSSVASVRLVRPSVPWRSQDQNISMRRTLARDGFCPTDLSRKSARYRNLLACGWHEALPHGYPSGGVFIFLDPLFRRAATVVAKWLICKQIHTVGLRRASRCNVSCRRFVVRSPQFGTTQSLRHLRHDRHRRLLWSANSYDAMQNGTLPMTQESER